MSKIIYYIISLISSASLAVQPHPAELGDYVAQVAVTQGGPNPTQSLTDINEFIHLGGTFMVNLLLYQVLHCCLELLLNILNTVRIL